MANAPRHFTCSLIQQQYRYHPTSYRPHMKLIYGHRLEFLYRSNVVLHTKIYLRAPDFFRVLENLTPSLMWASCCNYRSDQYYYSHLKGLCTGTDSAVFLAVVIHWKFYWLTRPTYTPAVLSHVMYVQKTRRIIVRKPKKCVSRFQRGERREREERGKTDMDPLGYYPNGTSHRRSSSCSEDVRRHVKQGKTCAVMAAGPVVPN